MGSKQIRTNQLIEPFGPGSIYTDSRGIPHVIGGLDYWFKSWDQTTGKMVDCSNRSEFERFEGRLSAILHVDRFCLPPDFRHVHRGEAAPPNAGLHVPALRFPSWYRHTATGELKRFNLQTLKIDRPKDGGRWQPVRFISVCCGGHLNEFPWKAWIGCTCSGDGSLKLTDRGGSELTSIRVHCSTCPEGSSGRKGKSLAKTTMVPDVDNGEQSEFQKEGIPCPGGRPWLGADARQANCNHPLVAALINQTNLYFARTLSAISLPDLKIHDSGVISLRNEIETLEVLTFAKNLWRMGETMKSPAVAMIKKALTEQGTVGEDKEIETALESLFNEGADNFAEGVDLPAEGERELLAFRREEFNILRNEISDSAASPNLCVVKSNVPDNLSPWIGRVNLVERLREMRAFFGFDRIKPSGAPVAGMPDSAMQQLFRRAPESRWLPAVEVFGEGIFVEISEKRISEWQKENEDWIRSRLDIAFINRLAAVNKTLPPLNAPDWKWASRYLLVHSLAHTLINQLVFECGYSTASLRERLYISGDSNAPMAGFLIYTASGDSDGTLGGLVRLGRPEKFGPVVHRAIVRASWCSADPICSEHLGGTGSMLANLAACHSCILLPETSCETINQGLDRAMIVGTPDQRSKGFMSDLLDTGHILP